MTIPNTKRGILRTIAGGGSDLPNTEIGLLRHIAENGGTGGSGGTGAAGPQGPAGPRGPRGHKGDKGDAGAAGANGIFLGTFADKAALTAANPTPTEGDHAHVGGKIQVYRGTAWVEEGAAPAVGTGTEGPVGPAGPRGPKGDPGNDGADGAAGSAGPQGAQGPKGDKGDTGDTGPAGPKGDTGDTGPAGPQGPAGTGSGGIAAADQAKLDHLTVTKDINLDVVKFLADNFDQSGVTHRLSGHTAPADTLGENYDTYMQFADKAAPTEGLKFTGEITSNSVAITVIKMDATGRPTVILTLYKNSPRAVIVVDTDPNEATDVDVVIEGHTFRVNRESKSDYFEQFKLTYTVEASTQAEFEAAVAALDAKAGQNTEVVVNHSALSGSVKLWEKFDGKWVITVVDAIVGGFGTIAGFYPTDDELKAIMATIPGVRYDMNRMFLAKETPATAGAPSAKIFLVEYVAVDGTTDAIGAHHQFNISPMMKPGQSLFAPVPVPDGADVATILAKLKEVGVFI